MSLTLQLAIAIAAGLAASSLIIALDLAQQPLLLVAIVLVASCLTPLLSRQSPTAVPAGKTGDAVGEREQGEVKWFNVSKGFGFIRRQNGEEIFVHFRSIREPASRDGGRKDNGRRGSGRERKALRDGQRVSFVVVDSDKGPQAEEVEALR